MAEAMYCHDWDYYYEWTCTLAGCKERDKKCNYMPSALRNVDKSTCWEPKIAFLIIIPMMIGHLYEHAAGKGVNWTVVSRQSQVLAYSRVPTSPK